MAAPRKTTARKTTAPKATAPEPAVTAEATAAEDVAAPEPAPAQEAAPASLRLSLGDRGKEVTAIQNALGVTTEKTFGQDTAKAVRRWQKANGYAPTGILTQRQYRRMQAVAES